MNVCFCGLDVLFFLNFDFKLLQNGKNLLLCVGIDQNFQKFRVRVWTRQQQLLLLLSAPFVSVVAAYMIFRLGAESDLGQVIVLEIR